VARQLWFDPTNPNDYVILSSTVSTPPAGYVMSETPDGGRGGQPLSQGATMFGTQQQQSIPGGDSSGGFPAYGHKGKNMNGILS